jgi:hypothetical protein
VAVVVRPRHGRLRWFGHLEPKSGDDWVSACRKVERAGEKCVGRGRKTWECLNGDVKLLGLNFNFGTSMYSVQGYVERIQFGANV